MTPSSKLRLFVLTISMAAAAAVARADTIVDTGYNPSVIGWIFTKAGNGYPDFWNATEFTLTDPTVIGSIESVFFSDTGGLVTLSVVQAAGVLPGPNTLFSTDFSVPAGVFGWQGAYGLEWSLPSGTYWVTYTTDIFWGRQWGRAPNPQPRDAFGNSDRWNSHETMDLSLRINTASSSPVPDAGSTLALIGAAFAGFAAVRRPRIGSARHCAMCSSGAR